MIQHWSRTNQHTTALSRPPFPANPVVHQTHCCSPIMNKTSQKHQLTVVPAIILRFLFLDTLSGDRWPSPAVLNLQQNGCSISSFPVYSRSEASGCLATRVRSQQQKQDKPVSVFCLMLQTCVFSSASMCGAFNGEHVWNVYAGDSVISCITLEASPLK